eukprot:1528046-Pyramimonas_sp.AAC.1
MALPQTARPLGAPDGTPNVKNLPAYEMRLQPGTTKARLEGRRRRRSLDFALNVEKPEPPEAQEPRR